MLGDSEREGFFSIPSSKVFILFSLTFGFGDALPWAGAEKTGAYAPDNYTPRPTDVPGNTIALFKRDGLGASVCGWAGGNLASPVVCPSDQVCVRDSAHSYVGCCPKDGPCTNGLWTTCTGAGQYTYQQWDHMAGNGILSCGTQSCYQNSYADGYSQYNCGNSDQATTIQTAYSGQPSDQKLQPVTSSVSLMSAGFRPFDSATDGVPSLGPTIGNTPLAGLANVAALAVPTSDSSSASASKAKSSASSAESTAAAVASSDPASSSSTDASKAETDSGGSSKNNSKTGIIVGAVIGSLFALAALIALALWCWRRKQNKKPPLNVPKTAKAKNDRSSQISKPLVREAQGPFQRLPSPTEPQMAFNSAPTAGPAVFPNQYGKSKESKKQKPYFPPPPREEVPLTSQVDNVDAFSNQWHSAIGPAKVIGRSPAPQNPYGRPRGDPFADPDTPVSERFPKKARPVSEPEPMSAVSAVSPVSPESVTGLVIGAARGSGIGNARGSGTGGFGRQRTEDFEARSEPLRSNNRQSKRSSDPGGGKGWSPQSLVMSPQTFRVSPQRERFVVGADEEEEDEDVPILGDNRLGGKGSRGSKRSRMK